MKALIINGSPRGDRGATAGVLKPFIEGMESAGADVELVNIPKLKINPCRGCFDCWWKTPGVCVQNDDMKDMLPKLADSDLTVYATPVYVDGMTGPLKIFLDRSIPLLEGKWELRDDHCRHPLRKGTKPGKIALVSVSGFTELDNFDPLVVHMKAAALNMGREFAGAVLRPCAWVIPVAEERGASFDDIIEALRDAGQQLVSKGKILDNTLETISRELVPRQQIFEEFG
ncbi:MAG: flavodoxin family protein [Candidatus Thorarchaeota archaeon]|jgi:multimeric flavodoxin WrbA